MSAQNSLTDRFDIYPVIQAPMAGVSTPQLAAAVSNAGGLGSLGIGASTVQQAGQLIDDTRHLTSRPFNVNVFCHVPATRDEKRETAWLQHLDKLFAEFGAQAPSAVDEIYKSFLVDDEAFELLLEKRPAVVSFHFGLPPKDRIQRLQEAGIYTLATATSLAEAVLIEQAGVDAIVAQGIEAGGHRGIFDPDAADEELSTMMLTRLLVENTKLPVIAAGGIMNGMDIRQALDLGAAAAQLGTAFVLCPESAANAGYRAHLMSERARLTTMTSVISGRPARGMTNRLTTHGETREAPAPASYPMAYDAAKQLNQVASRQGSHEFAAHWAGQGAALARELPAAELMKSLIEEIQI